MFTVYVLEDEEGKFYKGMTSNLDKRLGEHKRGRTQTTARMKNPRVVYTEKIETFEAARKRELYFKSSAGRRFLKKTLATLAQR